MAEQTRRVFFGSLGAVALAPLAGLKPATPSTAPLIVDLGVVTYIPGPPDITGTFEGFWDDGDDALFSVDERRAYVAEVPVGSDTKRICAWESA